MLEPCAKCNRHIEIAETTCPFCGAANEGTPRPRVVPSGRLSRVAVFTSSLLAAPACWLNTPPTGPTQHEPVPTGAATIHVMARWSDGRPFHGTIYVAGQTSKSEHTNAAGEVVFRNLAPGSYTVTLPNNHIRRAPATTTVEVRPDALVRVNLVHPPSEPYEPGHEAKPYGAPPARKRVV